MNVVVLIDADSLLWSSCYCKKEEDPEGEGYIRDVEEAIHKFDSAVFNILSNIEEGMQCNVSLYKMFVQGNNNFRKTLYPTYKVKRLLAPKPPLIDELRSYVVMQYNAFISNGVETDDTVAATQEYLVDTDFEGDRIVVIASIDKDYKQLNGVNIYNYGKDEWIQIEDGGYWLALQMLMGDSGDDVVGIYGVGIKGAEKILADVNGGCYLRGAYREYVRRYKSKARVRWERTYHQLKLHTRGVEVPMLTEFSEYA